MRLESLTLRSILARAVLLKLKRPVVARIATIPNWPIILIDLLTEEGVVGRSYLEPYTAKAMRYLIPALHDFRDLLKGLSEALHRCHAIDDLGLEWIEEPIVYDNFDGFARLSAELKTPIQIGENFYGSHDLYRGLQVKPAIC